MSSIRRIPLLLDLDDPVDCAIWQVLEPLVNKRRGGFTIRQALAKEFGLIASGSVTASTGYSDPYPKAVRPKPISNGIAHTQDESTADDQDAVESAADKFLDMFG